MTGYTDDHRMGDVEVRHVPPLSASAPVIERERAHIFPPFPFLQADDYLHNPDPKRDLKHDKGGSIFTLRGLQNLGCLALLVCALFGLCASSALLRDELIHKRGR